MIDRCKPAVLLIPLIAGLVLANCTESNAQEVERRRAQLLDKARDHLNQGEYADAVKQLEHLTRVFEKSANAHFLLADARFMNGQVAEAVKAYDRALELRPEWSARCWQRGLALYLSGEFELGKQQFEHHQTVNSQDVENSVWHLMCHSRTADLETARQQMIPISGDQRIPMPEVFRLFSGEGSVDQVMQAARSANASSESERNTYLYYAWLYSGLYYDMIGDPEQALTAMRKASDINPIAKAQLMGSVADVFLTLRDPENRN